MNPATHHPPETSEKGEEEPSPLEYARLHHLSRNYLEAKIGFTEVGILRDAAFEGLSDDSHLLQFDFGPELKIEERATLSKEAAILLRFASCEDDAEHVESLTRSLLDSREFLKKMRIELPLLESDHATDCRRFGSREGFEITTKDVRFPLEIVDEEKGEGLSFPSRWENRGSELMETLKEERLAIGKETMLYLQDTLKVTWTEDDEKALWAQEQTYKRVSPSLFLGRSLLIPTSRTKHSMVSHHLSPHDLLQLFHTSLPCQIQHLTSIHYLILYLQQSKNSRLWKRISSTRIFPRLFESQKLQNKTLTLHQIRS